MATNVKGAKKAANTFVSVTKTRTKKSSNTSSDASKKIVRNGSEKGQKLSKNSMSTGKDESEEKENVEQKEAVEQKLEDLINNVDIDMKLQEDLKHLLGEQEADAEADALIAEELWQKEIMASKTSSKKKKSSKNAENLESLAQAEQKFLDYQLRTLVY